MKRRKGHPLICHHAWVIAQPGGEYAEVCADCGAGATRDEARKIVAFDAKLPEERDRRGGRAGR